MGESLLLNIDSKKEECMIISSYGTKHYSIENKNNQIFLTNTEDESKYEIYIENNIVYLKNIENKIQYFNISQTLFFFYSNTRGEYTSCPTNIRSPKRLSQNWK